MSITDPGRHTVVIDIKEKTVPEAQNTTNHPTNKYAALQSKVVDNDRVVIWDCAWAPGAEPITSFDSRDVFLAIAEGGDLSIATAGEAPKVRHYDAGQAVFLPGGQARTIGSTSGTVHVMLVEVK
jgi:redox-sensitive bicupin YhaK (pirin superfamily)